MSTIVTRAGKGSALTWTEGDANITNLNNDKMENFTVAGDSGTSQTVSGGDTLTIAGGTGLSSVASATDTITINLDNTAVTAGSYTAANITVDAQGRITSAANGSVSLALDGLSDVVITAAATNDVLVYNGTNWVDTAADTLTVSAASTATTATGATNINISTTTGNTGDTTTYPVLVGALSTGNQLPHIDSGLSYNASTNALTATSFSGALNGTVGATTANTGAFTSLTASGIISITGQFGQTNTLDRVAIGATTASTGAFTTLSASSTVSGTGFSTYLASPPAIGGTAAAAGTFTDLTSTGLTTLKTYKETVYAGGSQTTAYTPNYSNGTVHTVTMGGNVTFAAPTNMVAGNSLTLILTQDATGSRTGTWNASYKWAGGTPTLSTTANAIDTVNIFYDGTNYLTSISKQDNSSTVTGLQINAAGELRLADSDSSHYVGFKSPATVSTNKIWTLPSADGTSGQVLSTDGAGALSWATASGGGNNIIVLKLGTSDQINLSTSGSTESWTLLSSGGVSSVSVSTNTFTLPAGTYLFQMPTITSVSTTYSDWKLQNTTDATEVALFTSNTISMSGVTKAFYWSPTTVFTIAASKTFRFQTSSGTAVLRNGATVNGIFTVTLIKI